MRIGMATSSVASPTSRESGARRHTDSTHRAARMSPSADAPVHFTLSAQPAHVAASERKAQRAAPARDRAARYSETAPSPNPIRKMSSTAKRDQTRSALSQRIANA